MATKFNIPQVRSLRINNMTTFPYDKTANFQKGINVIFGPNHSGKTTIVNSIRYGIFGMSLCYIPEGVQIRYFSDRINEKEKKSLQLSTLYSIKDQNITVKRTIFASGSPKVDASITNDVGKELEVQIDSVQLETDYDNYLRNWIGMSVEYLPFISDLMFADQGRNTFLWLNGIDRFVLDLLTSNENIEKLNATKIASKKAKEELKKLEDSKKKLLEEHNQKQLMAQSIKRDIETIEKSDIGKAIIEYDKLLTEINDCRSRITQGNSNLGEMLGKKSSLLSKVEINNQKLEEMKKQKEHLQGEAMKVFLTNPSDPEEYHLRNLIFNDKKCPMCYADLMTEVNTRIESQLCPLCGKGPLPGDVEKIDIIQSKIGRINSDRSNVDKERNSLYNEIQSLEKSLEELSKEIQGYKEIENELTAKLKLSRSFEEEALTKKIKKRRLEEIQSQNQVVMQEITNLEKAIEKQLLETDQTAKVYIKTLETCKLESNKALSIVKQRFSEFFFTAMKGNRRATLSEDFVPVLEGRRGYHHVVVSQSEKILMDIAFRVALLSTCAENNNTIASIILEAPDEVIDQSYLPSLAKAIIDSSANLSIIITTLSPDFLGYLVKGYDIKGKDKARLTNLLSQEAALTQKQYFYPKLLKYSSENE